MATYTCAEVEQALPALALGALDQTERADMLAHLSSCSACHALYAEYARVVDGMLLSTPERVPPPSLRQALLREVEASLAASPPARHTALDAAHDAAPVNGPVTTSAPVSAAPAAGRWYARALDWLRDSRFGAQRGWALAVAALAITCAVLGAQVVRLSEERVLLLRRVNEQQQALVTLVGSNVRVVALNGRPAAANARGSIRFSPDKTLALFEARDLPPLPPTQSYQLWLVYPDGTRDSGAVFNVPSTGETSLVILAPQPFNSYVRFGVSIEPAGGSPAPTGPGALSSSAS